MPGTTPIDLGPMADREGLSVLAAHWMAGTFPPALDMEDAGKAVAEAINPDCDPAGVLQAKAPAWDDADWFSSWSRKQLERQPDAASREAVAKNLNLLATGEADVVITGQQPGFLGGPLYTLYKVATCIALAELRSRCGRPTVPVFWSGDDDDDMEEAFSTRLWDPRRAAYLHSRRPDVESGTMVGAVGIAETAGPELAWLREQKGGLATELIGLWESLGDAGDDRGSLQCSIMARLLRGRGLLCVSGNDGRMLMIAAPLLRRCLDDLEPLAQKVRERGVQLVGAGYHAQISDASLTHPMHRVSGLARFRIDPAQAAATDIERLRPGVMLRSPVQDWLFRPAAVVVGPGERAYLEQLRPLYQALDLHRAPLVPRLFAVATDQGLSVEKQNDHDVSGPMKAFENSTIAALEDALNKVGAADAEQRARRLFERWLPSLVRSFNNATERDTATHDWRALRGSRQERVQPVCWAAALWGETFIDTVMAAAQRHLDESIRQPIVDWGLPVPSLDQGASS